MRPRQPHAVFVTDQVKPGGKRSHVEALCAGLEAIGWRISLVDWGQLVWIERAWAAGPMYALDRVHAALGHRWLVPALNECFRRRLRALRQGADPIDLFHIQEATSFPSARAEAHGVPVVVTVHGPMHREIASARGLPLDDPTIRWIRELEGRAFLEADAVISVDLAHAGYVRGFGRPEPIHVIPNFVDTRRYHPAVPSTSFPDMIEALVAQRKVLFCPRRLVPKNGVSVAIRALRLLEDAGSHHALVIAGDGQERRQLEALVADLNLQRAVHFLGSVPAPSMPGLYRRSDVIVVPSVPNLGVEEATSISALEGQACARPVIASDLGGLREIIQEGVTGLLLPPGDAAAIADAVQRVTADPHLASHLAAAGARHVQDRHSHVAGARRYAKIYGGLGVGPA